MAKKIVENEVFALRNGEQYTITDQLPNDGRWFAVMARVCNFPPGPHGMTRKSDGAPVEKAGIIACQWVSGEGWQWMQLSPATKEQIGDLLFDSGAEKDIWYYVEVK